MNKFKNLHLISSVLLLIIIALVYGFCPAKIIPALGELQPMNTDLFNAFKAIMGLYLAMATFWSLGVLFPKFWQAATLVNILFMFGLASGRLLSFVLDGLPDPFMFSAFALEIAFGIWGVISLKKYGSAVV